MLTFFAALLLLFAAVPQVTAGGFAEKAGLQEGDVLMGVSGVFGNVEAVVGQGVEKV